MKDLCTLWGGGTVFFDLTPILKNTPKTVKLNSTAVLFQLFQDFNNTKSENKRIDILLDIAFFIIKHKNITINRISIIPDEEYLFEYINQDFLDIANNIHNDFNQNYALIKTIKIIYNLGYEANECLKLRLNSNKDYSSALIFTDEILNS
ncbi:Uncharacterised protein [Campylobacter insulaenigrae]|uniref:hypothetical protein n=1 Tax=Campylobacter insulaenigrae TaxID=260714 RepID=UPI000F6E7780|nr:hypothetical protein [Campylobacter insulaenigrae]VEJ53277.1 Uncharacterised protein [Campylobacter insulaenigrae]